jgi:hypothetical protein
LILATYLLQIKVILLNYSSTTIYNKLLSILKTENYTTSALFFVGFFGIFLLMNFQTSIAGTPDASKSGTEEMSTLSITQDLLPDTLHWQKTE